MMSPFRRHPNSSKLLHIGERIMDSPDIKSLGEWWLFKTLHEKVAKPLGIKIGQTQQFISMALKVRGIEGRRIRGKKRYKFVEPVEILENVDRHYIDPDGSVTFVFR